MRLLSEATRATPFSFPTYQSVRETLGYPQVLFRSPLDHEEVFADVNSVGMTQDYLAVDTHRCGSSQIIFKLMTLTIIRTRILERVIRPSSYVFKRFPFDLTS